MIDGMIRPGTTGMTRRTHVRTAFFAYGQTDQRVRRCVMTRCTAVMDLVVAAARKRRGWIRMTDRTRRLDRYIT